MKKLDRIGRPCSTMTEFTSHQVCFLEPLFRLFTQGRRIAMLERIQLVTAWLHNSLNDAGPLIKHQKTSHNDSDNSQEVNKKDNSSHQQELKQVNEEDARSPLDINDLLSDEVYTPEEDDPKSDLSVSHHDQRKGRYDLVEEGDDSEEDDDTSSIEYEDQWLVESLNVSKECQNYTDYCFSKLEPKKMDDTGILALNNIYLFKETISTSITRHFGQNELHQKIIKDLDLFGSLPNPSPEVYTWCISASSKTYSNWRDVQSTTIEYLNQALKSENELDLIIANVLYRILPTFKISGYSEGRGEDSFVHDIFGPLLDAIFGVDVNMKRFWANVGLTSSHKDTKPDFGVYANGLSRRFVVLIAEFKPVDGRQTLEDDKVKIGKEMKKMLNELLEVGIEDPLVCGILVMSDHVYMYKMHLSGPKSS